MIKLFRKLTKKIFDELDKDILPHQVSKEKTNQYTEEERRMITVYKMDLGFSQMIPNKNYNGMSATKNVVDSAKKNVIYIRKYFKNKHNLDIHFELYGKKAKAMPWENSEN